MRRNRKVLKMTAWLLVMAMLMTGVPMPSTVFAGKAPKLNCKKATIKVGKTKKLKVKNAGRKKVKWSSSKKKVATVSSKGLVKGKSAGRTVIKAKVGRKTLKCGIIVKEEEQDSEETDDEDWDAWENQTDPPSRTAAAPAVEPPVSTPAKTAETDEPDEPDEPDEDETASPHRTASADDSFNTPAASPEETPEPVKCTVQITTYKDGFIWSDSGKIYYLKRQGEEVFETGMQVTNGVYDIYASDGKGTEPQDTGEDVEVTGHNRKIAIQYYTVSFMDANCLMQNIPQQIIRKGEKVKCPDIVPGKIGYEFAGWEIDEEDGNDPVLYDFDRKVTKTTVLQVCWKAASERTVYAAQCYYEDFDGSYPSAPSKHYESISAVADSVVTASDLTPEGFKPDPERNQDVSVKADGKTVAVYYYKRLSYTLTWDYYGGSDGHGGYSTETVKYGCPLTAPNNIKMTGCVCVGWADEDGNPLVSGGTMPAKDITYKAVWKKESEVDPTPVTETPVTETPATGVPQTKIPATEAPETEVPQIPATEAPETEVPQIPATDVPKTEVPQIPATDIPKTEVPVTQPPVTAIPVSTPVPTPVRYTVNIITRKDGAVWSDASRTYYLKKQGAEFYEDSFRVTNGVYEIYVKEDQNDIDTGISVTVYGKDTQVYVDYYTVSFMDGTSLMQDVDRQIVLSGRCAVKPSDDPGKQGYAFAGWMLNDTDTEYDFDLAVTAATVIKAKWEASSQSTVYKKEYYLEDLDGNYPSTASDTKEGISAIAGTLVKASDSVPEGFTPDDSRNSDVSVTADGNTVARFYYKRLNYSLTWDYNGGTRYGSTYTSASVKYGASLTEPSDVSYNGYQCAGWLDAQGQPFVAGSTMPAADLSYTAKWKTVEYSISYSGTEGAGASAVLPGGYTIESETFTIAALTRTGYTFLGWTGSNGSSPQQTVTIWKGGTGNLSYTANWKADPTATPAVTPTATPTVKPTSAPTAKPTAKPTTAPTAKPTVKPTAAPTVKPTAAPTVKPTATPTVKPTAAPTVKPTAKPTVKPTAAPTVKPTAKPTVKPTAAPTVKPTVKPTAAPTVKPTVKPTATPTATPTVTPTATPAGNKYVSSETVPTTADTDTLTVGKFSVTLGMSEAQVKAVFGHDPEMTGSSPQGCTVHVYNPQAGSGDYKGKSDYRNLMEIQFKDGQVVEMSTISRYFCYEGIVSSGDSTSDLTGHGFSKLSLKSYKFKAGYLRTTSNAYITAFVDHQGGDGVYGVQVFAKSLASSVAKLLEPDSMKANYNDAVADTMQQEMGWYVNAFRVFKGSDPMNLVTGSDNAAQTQAKYMASVGKNTTSGEGGISWSDRFDDSYGDPYVATEFTGVACGDAFGCVIYAIDDTSTVSSGQLTNVYQYMIMEESPEDGEAVRMSAACGFYYNTSSKLFTYGVIDIFGF